MKPISAMRQVRDKNRYWTVLKCLCSAAVLSGLYRPFKLGCQRTEETQLLKSQRIINSVLDLQICTAYQKSVICHMPNALCPIMQPLLGSSCSKEKMLQRVRVKDLGLWWTVGGKERDLLIVNPWTRREGCRNCYLIHHSHANDISFLSVREEHWRCWVCTFSYWVGIEKYGKKQMLDLFMRKQTLQWHPRSNLGSSTSGWAPKCSGLLCGICAQKSNPNLLLTLATVYVI